MPRKINYECVLAFRAPTWVRDIIDAKRGPGEQRSDVLRSIVIPAVTDTGEDEE